MHYLPEAALFALVPLTMLLLSWWNADPRRTGLENSLLVGCALLAAYALLLWISGQVFGQFFHVWPLLLAIALLGILLPSGSSFQERRAHLATHAKAALQSVRKLRGVELTLTLYLCAIFALTFALTLAPPNGSDYDALVYHLAAPQQYLRAGRIVQLPYDHHTYFPLTMEMLYLFGLWLRGPALDSGAVFAKMFHWLMLPLSCAALLAMGQRHLSLRAGLFAAALFASLPVVLAEASTAYVDLGLTAFSLLTFLCFSNWLSMKDSWWLAWCGVFCGFCLGLKYLGALVFIWLFLWLIGVAIARRKIEASAMLRFVVVTFLLGGGWYLRNWMWTRNPVFPFAYGIFDGRGWTAAMARAYTADQLKYGFGHSLSDWVWLPWRVAMTPLNIKQPFWPLSSVPVNNGTYGLFEVPGGLVLQTVIGPLLLAFGAPLIFARRKPPLVGFVLWSFAFFVLFWGLTGQYLRYLLPSFALLCLACGWGICHYLKRSAILQWSAAAAVVAWFIFAPLFTLCNARGSLAVISGQQTAADYLTHTFPGYDAMRWASTQTPANARFAVYGEPRCFYLERDYFWADAPHSTLLDYAQVKTGADLVLALRQQPATYVLWNTQPERNGGFGGPPSQINQAIEQGLLTLEFEAKSYRIYRIAVEAQS